MEESKSVSITARQFYFETPLYTLVENEHLTEDIWKGEFDAYSAKYDTPTTYSIKAHPVAEDYYQEYQGVYRVTLTNKRKDDDELIFFVFNGETAVAKIGQMPSLAALQTAGINDKYRKQLSKSHYAAFTRAIGLSAHGVGAGSLVYLRRIFADLIDETYEKNKASIKITAEEYKNLRMDERVTALKVYLPSQLVEMKAIYGILSSGIHNLSEADCLKYFSPLKLSIELILDQLIKEKEEADREKAVKAEIAKIQQQLKTQQ
jgi:hypothetical protein